MQQEQKTQILEQHLTPEEIAEVLKVHPSTVRRRFIDEPGVLRLGSPGGRGRRQRFVLRIPRSVFERVYGQLTIGGGGRAA